MMSQRQKVLLILLLISLLSSCIQQDTIYRNDEEQKLIYWGGNTKPSIYLNPIAYAESDPLGNVMQYQQAYGQHKESGGADPWWKEQDIDAQEIDSNDYRDPYWFLQDVSQ